MQQKDNYKKLKQKFISVVDGPLLFTAPHSKKLYRGGKLTGDERRIHLRQIYTSMLAVEFAAVSAKMIGLDKNRTNSFCVWGKSSVIDEQDLDPNYLHPKQYELSGFHQTLHKFQINNTKVPIFHVDIHGKYDRKDGCQLDIGLACMEEFWEDDQLVGMLKNFFNQNFGRLFQGMKIGNFQPRCNCEPYLSGLWGGNIATMNEQAIRLGIPSIQLQIPRKMRNLLAKDDKFRMGFLQVLVNAYQLVIIKWFPFKLQKSIFYESLASKLPILNYSKKDIEQLLEEIKQMQEKTKLNLNAKII